MLEFKQDKREKWRWSITADNHEVLSASSQGFSTKQKADENLTKTADRIIYEVTSQKGALDLIRKIRDGLLFVSDIDAGDTLTKKEKLLSQRSNQLSSYKKQNAQLEAALEDRDKRIDNFIRTRSASEQERRKHIEETAVTIARFKAVAIAWKNVCLALVGLSLVSLILSIFIL